MPIDAAMARAFGLEGDAWMRHANPWSVYTRIPIPPLMAGAIWSRGRLGRRSLLPIALVCAWTVINPRAFPPVCEPRSWAARGIYGERAWLQDRDLVPPDHRKVLRLLVTLGLIGFGLILWGLIALEVWPTVFGTTMVVVAQLWRIDRFGWLWERHRAQRS